MYIPSNPYIYISPGRYKRNNVTNVAALRFDPVTVGVTGVTKQETLNLNDQNSIFTTVKEGEST